MEPSRLTFSYHEWAFSLPARTQRKTQKRTAVTHLFRRGEFSASEKHLAAMNRMNLKPKHKKHTINQLPHKGDVFNSKQKKRVLHLFFFIFIRKYLELIEPMFFNEHWLKKSYSTFHILWVPSLVRKIKWCVN